MRTSKQMKRQAGFSLPELMIAMVVMLIVVAAVLSQVKSAFQVTNAAYELTEAQQSLRFAQEYLNRDLVSAGDGLRGINSIRVHDSFVNTYLTTASVTNPTDPNYITLPIITSDDNVPGTTPVARTNPAVNVRGGTDRITILLIDSGFTSVSLLAPAIDNLGQNVSLTPAQLAAGNFRVGEIYFFTSPYGAAFGAITGIAGGGSPNLIFANTDLCGLNRPGNTGPIRFVSRGPNNQPVPTSLMRIQMIQYFVNANGALVRRVFGARGSVGFRDSVVAENVTNLQVRYFLNNVAQPVTQLATAQQQVAVRQVEVTVTVQTEHPVANGQRQSVGATTMTSIRNLQFRQSL